MKRKWIPVVCCWLAAAGFASAQKAEALLEKAAAAYEKAGGISVQFAANLHGESRQISESFEGTIRMKADKFVLVTPDIRTWYDGSTQWTYMVRTEEVNITRPSGDELPFTNPMTLLRTWKKDFKPACIGESTVGEGKMADDVSLVAKSSGQEVETVELQLDRATSLPARMTVTMKNKLRSVIRIDKMQTGLDLPDKLFTFPEADYPNVEIVDLR
ncbi:MAG: outer-membrane lipoprotein carrier protein LolA [Tannerella sp.]|jgi:outer membrane lipoprotein-sorting protein|nr:outer-membrane lipoprotein carrier protein LolA [Tannerella sp.]